LLLQAMSHLREKLVLASGSPRRAEILERAGWPHEIIVPGIDETVLPNEDAAAYVQRLARSKAEAVASRLETGLVLGADTTVVVANQILGQPLDDADARRMLRLLNAKWHDVLTGVAVVHVGGETRVGYQRTRVRFAEMSETEIDWYIATGEPFGKAGAYAVQGAGAALVSSVTGSVSNVIGLPLHLVVELARQLGVELLSP
jgi:septum formation protein